MIGVICRPEQRRTAEELFRLFRTPWSWADQSSECDVLLVTDCDLETEALEAPLILRFRSDRPLSPVRTTLSVGDLRLPLYGGAVAVSEPGEPVAFAPDGRPLGVARSNPSGTTIVLGYDVLDEIEFLLKEGQPSDEAAVPTLDLHLDLLRRWIVDAGVPLVEILPRPWGFKYIACLTHDIDFFGIRRHGVDHTVLGFAYRASLGTLLGALHGRRTWRQVRRNLAALAKLPLVHLGLTPDFWQPFDDYRDADGEHPSTYFVIPFRKLAGEHVPGRRAHRRATKYDIRDVAEQVAEVERLGSEVAVHGIDAWHSASAGRKEHDAVASTLGRTELGVRMHWLCYDSRTPAVLEAAGFPWDATFGYNDTVGYRAGTTQIYAPPGSAYLLEVPLHAQDTALFLARRLDLPEEAAWEMCNGLRDHAGTHGGVLAITWHDRSLAPERLWDSFYRRLLEALRADAAWFTTISAAVARERARRATAIRVEKAGDRMLVHLQGAPPAGQPAFTVRLIALGPDELRLTEERPWRGESTLEFPAPEPAAMQAAGRYPGWPCGRST